MTRRYDRLMDELESLAEEQVGLLRSAERIAERVVAIHAELAEEEKTRRRRDRGLFAINGGAIVGAIRDNPQRTAAAGTIVAAMSLTVFALFRGPGGPAEPAVAAPPAAVQSQTPAAPTTTTETIVIGGLPYTDPPSSSQPAVATVPVRDAALVQPSPPQTTQCAPAPPVEQPASAPAPAPVPSPSPTQAPSPAPLLDLHVNLGEMLRLRLTI